MGSLQIFLNFLVRIFSNTKELFDFWTPALAEVSYEFHSAHLSVHLSICGERSKNWVISFFLFFCMKLGSNKVGKVMVWILKQSLIGSGMPKKSRKCPQNEVFVGFDKNPTHFMHTFFPWIWKYLCSSSFQQKNQLSGKIWFMRSKNL